MDTLFRSLFNSLPPLPHSHETVWPGQEHIRFLFFLCSGVVMLVRATRRSKMFPNLSERHCVISRDSLLPRHCNPIRADGNSHACYSEGVGGRKGGGEGGRGGRRTESRQLHLARGNSCRLSARECKTSSALNQQ